MRLLLSYLLALLVLLSACGEKQESTQVKTQDLTVSVYASATVKARNQYQVYSTVTGIVQQILVEEGDSVAANRAIYTIENNNPALNTENAKLAYQLAQQNYGDNSSVLNNLKNQIQLSRQVMQEDSANYERQQSLWSQGIGSKVELEQMKLKYENSKSNYINLKNQLSQTQNELSTALQQAKNNYQMSLNSAADFQIKSLISGKVYALQKEIGELVSMQQPVAIIGNADDFILELEIDEQDITKVQIDQEVILRLDAMKGETLKAKVSKIYPVMDSRSQTFKIEAEFNTDIANLYPGLSGEANIVVEQKTGVLTIPIAYLLDDRYVVTEDEERHEVGVGAKSLTDVEITSGLSEGQTIYKPTE